MAADISTILRPGDAISALSVPRRPRPPDFQLLSPNDLSGRYGLSYDRMDQLIRSGVEEFRGLDERKSSPTERAWTDLVVHFAIGRDYAIPKELGGAETFRSWEGFASRYCVGLSVRQGDLLRQVILRHRNLIAPEVSLIDLPTNESAVRSVIRTSGNWVDISVVPISGSAPLKLSNQPIHSWVNHSVLTELAQLDGIDQIKTDFLHSTTSSAWFFN